MDADGLFSLRTAAAVIAGATCLLYVICLSIYRLYLCPISRFPGPKLAALTYWYEIYYDVFKEGVYLWEIEKMHKKYGPIVRINPHELHIIDLSFLETLYSRSSPRDKPPRHARVLGIQGSTFGTTTHAMHRIRRGAISQFLSKRMVTLLEPLIQSKVEMLCSRLAAVKGKGVLVPIRLAYASFTTDVITEYTMRKSYGHLEDKDFAPLWCKTLVSSARVMHIGKHFPLVYHVLKRSPEWLVGLVSPGFAVMLKFQKETRDQVQRVIDNPDISSRSSKSNPSIFHEILNSDLPAKEKSLNRLTMEGVTLVTAGSETTAATLGLITYFLSTLPKILKKLKEELETAMPDPEKPLSCSELEQLPYLTGVISEGLRLSFGVSHRLPKIATEEDLSYREWTIPRGTPVSTCSVIIHRDPTIFPSPDEFLPDRWLNTSQSGPARLSRYLLSFSGGSRQCVGINLARAELFMVVANLFRRFDMELLDATRDYVDIERDWFMPVPKKSPIDMKVLIK